MESAGVAKPLTLREGLQNLRSEVSSLKSTARRIGSDFVEGYRANSRGNNFTIGGLQNGLEGVEGGIRNVAAKAKLPQAVGGDWKFKSANDLDWRGKEGGIFENYKAALDEAFNRTGVPRNAFEVTKEATSIDGKTLPVEWRVNTGKFSGAEVNADNPRIIPTFDGPADPHVGYQTPGKRSTGGAVRGHIILDDIPVTRGKLNP